MANPKDIKQATDQLATARVNLADAYYSLIRDAYRNVPESASTIVTVGLESILINLMSAGAFFDRDKAREIRENLGMTQQEVAKEAGLRVADVNMFETGKQVPTPFSTANKHRGYLDWLKKQGYEPYSRLSTITGK